MLSSLLASIYQCQEGSRSAARVHVRVFGGVVRRVAGTDEENGRGQQRMRSALKWEDGGKDELQQEGPGRARVRLSVIHRHVTARQN